ncbi:hypothetical protein FB390_1466 [Nocardia bhagyanarayanae]|uniref:Uncharacterized protein n=1 Tax=Nocardia bhagyanarayanae TaxID=1215925 RepID=A0A543F7Q3_9NOCA|nr:hypothetical protein FB390_1466 [Nocardia bhagyanarayanae]
MIDYLDPRSHFPFGTVPRQHSTTSFRRAADGRKRRPEPCGQPRTPVVATSLRTTRSGANRDSTAPPSSVALRPSAFRLLDRMGLYQQLPTGRLCGSGTPKLRVLALQRERSASMGGTPPPAESRPGAGLAPRRSHRLRPRRTACGKRELVGTDPGRSMVSQGIGYVLRVAPRPRPRGGPGDVALRLEHRGCVYDRAGIGGRRRASSRRACGRLFPACQWTSKGFRGRATWVWAGRGLRVPGENDRGPAHPRGRTRPRFEELCQGYSGTFRDDGATLALHKVSPIEDRMSTPVRKFLRKCW